MRTREEQEHKHGTQEVEAVLHKIPMINSVPMSYDMSKILFRIVIDVLYAVSIFIIANEKMYIAFHYYYFFLVLFRGCVCTRFGAIISRRTVCDSPPGIKMICWRRWWRWCALPYIGTSYILFVRRLHIFTFTHTNRGKVDNLGRRKVHSLSGGSSGTTVYTFIWNDNDDGDAYEIYGRYIYYVMKWWRGPGSWWWYDLARRLAFSKICICQTRVVFALPTYKKRHRSNPCIKELVVLSFFWIVPFFSLIFSLVDFFSKEFFSHFFGCFYTSLLALDSQADDTMRTLEEAEKSKYSEQASELKHTTQKSFSYIIMSCRATKRNIFHFFLNMPYFHHI